MRFFKYYFVYLPLLVGGITGVTRLYSAETIASLTNSLILLPPISIAGSVIIHSFAFGRRVWFHDNALIETSRSYTIRKLLSWASIFAMFVPLTVEQSCSETHTLLPPALLAGLVLYCILVPVLPVFLRLRVRRHAIAYPFDSLRVSSEVIAEHPRHGKAHIYRLSSPGGEVVASRDIDLISE